MATLSRPSSLPAVVAATNVSDPDADLAAGDDRGQQVPPAGRRVVGFAARLGKAEGDRRGDRIRVEDGPGVDVVHLEGMSGGGVGEGGLRPTRLRARAEQ